MSAGGWTVLFRRDKAVDMVEFQVPIKTYKHGFGDVNTNHFIGMIIYNVDKQCVKFFFNFIKVWIIYTY